ncbi:MAG: LysR family transcriptional regulator [Phoenicibacter congonensis]|uniref:LysR family transcriptional regulator n=1 Tax=Phoenicibacter congonensis TaxID=1944646 RepID=A0AA43RI97_9ACTN|nr:LysR family transcriptional regulator [Phoenicibacter congonensis]
MEPTTHIVPAIKLSFVNPDSDSRSVLGKGVIRLMQYVEETNSLNQAAKNMNMAYSKAWKITKRTSEALGFELIESVRPTGSRLTPEGKQILEIYLALEKDLKNTATKKFNQLSKESSQKEED